MTMFTGSNFLISGGTFTTTTNVVHDNGFNRLGEAAAHGAFHDSGQRHSPPKCHKNTRLNILKRISDWLSEDKDPLISVMWLHAAAGVGKSAIAQTFAEQLAKEKRLLASFFFSRFDPLRNNGDRLVTTIAYQVALNIPELREAIVSVVNHDPLILGRSPDAQFRELIVEPVQGLLKSGYFNNPLAPRLIILDGLDECKDKDIQVNIIRLISTYLDNYPNLPLKFLICSRPEPHLAIGFDSSFTQGITLFNLHQRLLNDDIRSFLEDKFNDIKRTHPLRAHIPSEWPDSSILYDLVKNSGGQFLYASTVIKYVENIRHRPPRQLDRILSKNREPFTAIDQLYRDIFSSIEDPQQALDILCVGLLWWPHLDLRQVENFFTLEPGDPELILGELASVLTLTREEDFDYWLNGIHWVRITHASLDDFLRDPSRSKEFHIDAPHRHARLARRCVELIKGPDPSLLEHSYRRLPYHMGFATPEDQRSIVLDLPLSYLFQETRRSSHYIIELIGAYFDFGKKDIELHNSLWHMLQVHVFSLLETYYSDANLTFLVAVVGLVGDEASKWSFQILTSIGVVAAVIPNTVHAIDKQGLKLVEALRSGSCGSSTMHLNKWNFIYVQLLLAVLKDKSILPTYALNGQRYALAVVTCLQYLCCYPACQCTIPPHYIPGDRGREYAHNRNSDIKAELLPLLLERAEPVAELEDFINRNIHAKMLLREVLIETKLENVPIAKYLNDGE